MKFAAIVFAFALVSSPVGAEPTVGCPSFNPSAAAMTLEAAADEWKVTRPKTMNRICAQTATLVSCATMQFVCAVVIFLLGASGPIASNGANPSLGDAGGPDDRRGTRRLDTRAMG